MHRAANEIPIKQINILGTGEKWADGQSKLNDFSKEKGGVVGGTAHRRMTSVMKL